MPVPFCHREDDLYSKLCPMMIGKPMATNGGSNSCIGRSCMAWRFVETHVKDARGDLVPSGDTHGYCGMAGDPRRTSAFQ